MEIVEKITLPPEVLSLIDLQSSIHREAKVENKYPIYESHKALLWLATDSEEEYEEAHRIYREKCGM